MSKPSLKISARISLKNKPAGYLGITSTNVVWGETSSNLTPLQLMHGVLSELFDWFVRIYDTKTLNRDVAILIEWLQTVHFEDKPTEAKAEEGAE